MLQRSRTGGHMRWIVSLILGAAIVAGGAHVLVGYASSGDDPATSTPDEPRAAVDLSFGVYSSDKPSTMLRMFRPVLVELERLLSAELEAPVTIRLDVFKTYDEGLDAICRGRVDFFRLGPASYVLAKRKSPDLELLAMELVDGKKAFHGVILVRKESRFQTLHELRGATFAFGDESSTIGRYLSQLELLNAGIRGRDLARYEYLGRHDKVVNAVAVGDFEAGAAKESTFQKLNREGELRVLHRFENVTKPWIARAGLPPKQRLSIGRAILRLTDEKALATLKVSGFTASKDEDYATVREAMDKARAFEAE